MLLTSIVLLLAAGLFGSGRCFAFKTSSHDYFVNSGLSPCPVVCELVGSNAANWTRYPDPSFLNACARKPKLVNFLVEKAPNAFTQSIPIIRACTTYRGRAVFDAQFEAYAAIENDHTLQLATPNITVMVEEAKHKVITPQFVTTIKELQASLLFDHSEESGTTAVTVHYGNTVIGVHVGAAINKPGVAITALDQLLNHIRVSDAPPYSTLALQVCDQGSPSDYILGIFADNTPGEAFDRVASALASWQNATCIGKVGQNISLGQTTLWYTNATTHAYLMEPPIQTNVSWHNNTRSTSLVRRADCKTIQVVSGDSCGALASKCGISGADFTKHNPGSSFCSSLRPGQRACCSSGTLPDFRPKPDSDGSCAWYLVKAGDWCDSIAASNGLKLSDLDEFNKQTWGWSGCDILYAGIKMCLSSGSPPMPAPIENAVCGPQKPGTSSPSKGTDPSNLNPCPLNACCNVWGQCGTTADFCTRASLGPPGTSEPGKNGCISNCGTNIVNNDQAPKNFMKLGYFEAWNKKERPCLHMDVTQIDKSYTHVHFAFADVTPQFSVTIGPVREQFEKFVNMRGPKRILAFGGWTASTSPSSYWIFREGVKPANRDILTTHIANFVRNNNLDGVDIDWEYPGAPDIPGIPAAEPIDGANYLALLKLLRAKLNKESISIAAPASYWYLKSFPINEIAKVVDYIVYMTYDLHGQWDYNNAWANPGCPRGNCLRSHVNLTETMNSLSMITKAGVPSSKIIVGVSSYGRSFRMTESSCTGPLCTFSGPESSAAKGECTRTAGYIANAEISKILGSGLAGRYYDGDSDSDILVYGSDWVAYMGDGIKAKRTDLYRRLNFGGTTDWAVDLAAYVPDAGGGNGGDGIALPIETDDDWKEVGCDHPLADDENANVIERWEQLKCKSAWDAGITEWHGGVNPNELSFVRFLSNFWKGPVDMECNVTAEENGCFVGVKCDDKLSPGAAMILRGFTKVSKLQHNFYEGMTDASNTADSQMDSFTSTFAPEVKPDESLDWLFSFLGIGLGMVGGPLFQKAFATSKFFIKNPTAQETMQETVMSGIDVGISKANDALKEGTVVETSKQELSDALMALTVNWKIIIESSTAALFSGLTDSDIEHLFTLINQNKMILTSLESTIDIEKRVLRALYAYLIPYAWRLRGITPVLLDDGLSCDDVGSGDYEYIYPDETEKIAVCVDDKNYFLLDPKGLTIECFQTPHSGDRCTELPLSLLPGFDGLGEVEDDTKPSDEQRLVWGGITRDDIVKGVLSRFAAKGSNKDLDKPPEIDTDEGKQILWDQIDGGDIVLVPGVVQIPKCGAAEVRENWRKKQAGKDMGYLEYPCNPS